MKYLSSVLLQCIRMSDLFHFAPAAPRQGVRDFTSSDFLSVFKVDIRMNKAVDDEKNEADFPADSTGTKACSCSCRCVFERK